MANAPRRPRVIPSREGPVVLEPGETRAESTGSTDTGSRVQRGDRPVKEYYLYDSDFRELKTTGIVATSLFALGSAAVGFAVNVHTSMIFAENLKPVVKLEWTQYRNAAIIAAAILYLIAGLAAASGYNRVEQIKAETSHGGERYQPKSRYRVAMIGLALLSAAGIGAVVMVLIW